MKAGQLGVAKMATEGKRDPMPWKERALKAEMHNQRVGALLANYIVRNQLMLPNMSAGFIGAQTSFPTHSI